VPHLQQGPQPKHSQLREILRRRVQSELPAGAPIPSERELADCYGVSRLTVRAAIGKLVDEGLLARVPGKGTFTVGKRVEAQLYFESFTEELSRRGHRTTTEVLAAEARPIDPSSAAALGLAAQESAFYLSRLRRADDVALAVESGWYNPHRVPGLPDFDLTGSVYAQLAERCGVVLDHASQTISAEEADAATAHLLEIPAGAPLLVLRRVSSAAGVPVEDMTSAYRGDLYRLSMQMDRAGLRPSPVNGGN
jgi:GntR family transcriptional regulator